MRTPDEIDNKELKKNIKVLNKLLIEADLEKIKVVAVKITTLIENFVDKIYELNDVNGDAIPKKLIDFCNFLQEDNEEEEETETDRGEEINEEGEEINEEETETDEEETETETDGEEETETDGEEGEGEKPFVSDPPLKRKDREKTILGSGINSKGAKIDALLLKKPISIKELAKKSGRKLSATNGHLTWLRKKGKEEGFTVVKEKDPETGVNLFSVIIKED